MPRLSQYIDKLHKIVFSRARFRLIGGYIVVYLLIFSAIITANVKIIQLLEQAVNVVFIEKRKLYSTAPKLTWQRK